MTSRNLFEYLYYPLINSIELCCQALARGGNRHYILLESEAMEVPKVG